MTKVFVPPIKIQGIKTKLVQLIKDNIYLEETSTYFEPFFGSGVVGFNLAPYHAIFSDTNPYLINFYQAIQNKTITSGRMIQ
jgi:DNA adenine methylase